MLPPRLQKMPFWSFELVVGSRAAAGGWPGEGAGGTARDSRSFLAKSVLTAPALGWQRGSCGLRSAGDGVGLVGTWVTKCLGVHVPLNHSPGWPALRMVMGYSTRTSSRTCTSIPQTVLESRSTFPRGM